MTNVGRPTIYSEDLSLEICERIGIGDSLVTICKDPLMPALTTVYRWLESDPQFRDRYAWAREVQADVMADEIVDIADDSTNDTQEDEDGRKIVNYDNIQRARLRVDARKWIAAKLKPKKYGDRQGVELSGAIAIESLADRLMLQTSAMDEDE